MISKTKLISFFTAFALCMLLLVFQLTPFVKLEQVIIMFLSFIGAFLYISKYTKLPKLFKNWTTIFLFLGSLSVFTNVYIQNTTFFSGVIGSLAYFKVLALVPIFILIKDAHYLDKTIHYLKIFGVFHFLILLLFFVFDIKLLFVGIDSSIEVSAVKLNKTLVNFISFLFIGLYFIKNKSKYLLIAVLLFSANMFGDFQRWIFFSFLLTLLIGFVIQKNIRIKLKIIPFIIVSAVLSLLVISFTSVGDVIVTKISDALALLSDSKVSQDASVNARVWESEIALTGFYESPVIGNGVFRNSVKENLFGDAHFYLSDIGIVGLLYAFGIIGPLVYVLQIKTSFKMAMDNSLQMGLKLFMIFLLTFSVLTGSSILQPTIFMVVILLYVKTKQFGKISISERE